MSEWPISLGLLQVMFLQVTVFFLLALVGGHFGLEPVEYFCIHHKAAWIDVAGAAIKHTMHFSFSRSRRQNRTSM